MIWHLDDIQTDLELLRKKYDDLMYTHIWAGDDIFKYDDVPANKDELMSYAIGYNEARISHMQTYDMMHYYLNEFDRIINKIDALKNASSEQVAKLKSDNA